MEKMKKSTNSIKKTFGTAVSLTMLAVFFCSAITIYGCWRVQKYLLPDSKEVWLQTRTTYTDGSYSESKQLFRLDTPTEISKLIPTENESNQEEHVEYTVEMIKSSYSQLSPKQKILYRGSQSAMIMFPVLYSAVGVILCVWWFYCKKIVPPVEILADAVVHIQKNTLDFQVVSPSKDELGQLCSMFETMRQILYENNRQLWRTIEDQRILQASVAHDLRNPITILEGYIEYLQSNLPTGRLSGEKLDHTLSNMSVAAKRLEKYTDCIRNLNALEEIEIKPSPLSYPNDLEKMINGLSIMTRGKGIPVNTDCQGSPCTLSLDQIILSRILENILANAMRYAKSTIQVSSHIKENRLTICITDDGPGFSANILSKKATMFYSEDPSSKHLGLGLATVRILCQKQGGQILLSNIPSGGACVRILLPLPVSEKESTF